MAFGKFFDKFKGKNKKRPEEEEFPLLPEEITLWDLKKGYMLDYEARTWEVKGVYQYDWGRSGKTTEYKLHDGIEIIFMHLDQEDGELVITMSQKIKMGELGYPRQNESGLGFRVKSDAVNTVGGQQIRNAIMQNDVPPKEIVYQGTTYYMTEESEGYFRDLDERERYRFIEWSFEDNSEEKCISISRWSETELEVSAGVYAQDFEISNILPR